MKKLGISGICIIAGALMMATALTLFVISVWIDKDIAQKLDATGLVIAFPAFFLFLGGFIAKVE